MGNPEVEHFETHVTLQHDVDRALEEARAWAVSRGLKWTHIELSSGTFASQPMVTFWGSDSLPDQLSQAETISRELAELGCEVVRVKVEVANSEALPASQVIEPTQYFECHVKLLLKSRQEHDDAIAVAAEYEAHISRNARRTTQDGIEQRFMTLRNFGTSKEVADHRQQQLLGAIQFVGLTILEVESELVVFDSNLRLDDGWEQ